MAYTPSFSTPKTIKTTFVTNNPRGEDRHSDPVQIQELRWNDNTRTIEVDCSDRRTRYCRIDRFQDDSKVKALEKALNKAFINKALVQFIAAGGNDANVWFYNIKGI